MRVTGVGGAAEGAGRRFPYPAAVRVLAAFVKIIGIFTLLRALGALMYANTTCVTILAPAVGARLLKIEFPAVVSILYAFIKFPVNTVFRTDIVALVITCAALG